MEPVAKPVRLEKRLPDSVRSDDILVARVETGLVQLELH
jgi:hypothetical protein